MRLGVLRAVLATALVAATDRRDRGDGRDVLASGRGEGRAPGCRALLRADGAVGRPARRGAVRCRMPGERHRALGRRPQLGVRLRARPARGCRLHVHRQARPRDPRRRGGRAGDVRLHHRGAGDPPLAAVRRRGDRREPGVHPRARRAGHRCVDRGERLVRRRGRRRADRRAPAPGRREGEDPGEPRVARRPVLPPDLQDRPRRAAGDDHRPHQGPQGRAAPGGRASSAGARCRTARRRGSSGARAWRRRAASRPARISRSHSRCAARSRRRSAARA